MESAEGFIEKVRSSTRDELRTREKRHRPTFLRNLSRGLGYFLIALGVLVGAGFLLTMESVYNQLGVLSDATLADSLVSTANLESLMRDAGLFWIPDFLNIYSIRYLIVLGIFAFFGLLATAALLFGNLKKDTP